MDLGGEIHEYFPFFSSLSCHSSFLLFQSTHLSLFCLSSTNSFNFGIDGCCFLGSDGSRMSLICSKSPLQGLHSGGAPFEHKSSDLSNLPIFFSSLCCLSRHVPQNFPWDYFQAGKFLCSEWLLHFPIANCWKFSGISTLNCLGVFSASMSFLGRII